MLDPIITLVVPLSLSLLLVLLHFSVMLSGYISVPDSPTGCSVCSSVIAFWLGIPCLSGVSYHSVILSNLYLVRVYWHIGIFRGSWCLCGTSIYLWGPPYSMPLRIRFFMATISSFGAIHSSAWPHLALWLLHVGILSMGALLLCGLCFVCLD